jgi:hypothetical protein
MIRFISEDSSKKSNLKKNVLLTLSAAIALTPVIAAVPSLVQAAEVGIQPAVGDGLTAETAYLITTPDELIWVRNNLTKYFKLGAAIDLSGILWAPIGDSDTPFTGEFDGNGYQISNLTIDSNAVDIGLFGVIGEFGVVRKVGLEHANVKYSNPIFQNGGYTGHGGVLAGTNIGTIEKSYAKGALTIEGNGAVSIYSGGGLVGNNTGAIENSFSQVSVFNDANSLNQSYDSIGGLAGINNGTISKSYSTGAITDVEDDSSHFNNYVGEYIGGLVGYNYHYHSGPVDSFWSADGKRINLNNAVSNLDIDNNVGAHVALESDMKVKATYIEWNFDTVWDIREGVTHPFLRYYSPTVASPVADRTIQLDAGTVGMDVYGTFADPANDQLTINAVSTETDVVQVQVNGTELLLTPVAFGTATVTASAYDSQGAMITDSFTVTVVADATAPTVSTAVVSSTARNQVEMTFNETVTAAVYDGFTIKVDDVPFDITGVSGSGTKKLTFNLNTAVRPGRLRRGCRQRQRCI